MCAPGNARVGVQVAHGGVIGQTRAHLLDLADVGVLMHAKDVGNLTGKREEGRSNRVVKDAHNVSQCEGRACSFAVQDT